MGGEEEKRRAHIALGVACVASVPVWFRSKERPKNDKERDFRSLPREKWNERAKIWLSHFDSLSSCYLPRNHTEPLPTQATLGKNFLFWRQQEPSSSGSFKDCTIRTKCILQNVTLTEKNFIPFIHLLTFLCCIHLIRNVLYFSIFYGNVLVLLFCPFAL